MTFIVGAYWGARAELAPACAVRASETFVALAQVDDAFRSWYRRGTSARARTPFPTDPASLLRALERGRNRRDVDHSVITTLGFAISAWNGQDPAADLSIQCGLTAPRIPNSVVVTYPGHSIANPSTRDQQRLVLAALVSNWLPDWAVARRGEQKPSASMLMTPPHIGDLTWISSAYALDRAKLPRGADVSDLETGTLITAEREIADDPSCRSQISSSIRWIRGAN